MTSISEPTITHPAQADPIDFDEREFHAALAEMTKTDVLFIGTLAGVIRERAAERGLTIPRKVTSRYIEQNGKSVPIGPDIRISEGAADFIESVVMNTMAAIIEAIDAAESHRLAHALLARITQAEAGR